MQRPLRLTLPLLAALALMALASAAHGGEISSVYTPLHLGSCKDLTPDEAEEYGAIWGCEGYEGMDVRVAEGDLRMFVSFGPDAEDQTAAEETLPQFNTIGETLEWRVVKEDGQWKPFATILRYRWDSDMMQGSTLVVTKLGEDDACHVAYIEATGNSKANVLAREIADREAQDFDCKNDQPRRYAADGTLAD